MRIRVSLSAGVNLTVGGFVLIKPQVGARRLVEITEVFGNSFRGTNAAGGIGTYPINESITEVMTAKAGKRFRTTQRARVAELEEANRQLQKLRNRIETLKSQAVEI